MTAYHGVSAAITSQSLAAALTYEQQAGKGAAILQFYQSWGSVDFPSFRTSVMDAIRAHGSIPMVSWQPQVPGGGATQPAYKLSAIIAGDHDAYINTWAQAAKAWGHPFFLRLAAEMNADWYPWGTKGGHNGNTPAEYIAAWQHVHGIFAAQGVRNVTWVWCPNRPFTGVTPMVQLYPGDDYVDWMALDAYNHGTDQGGSWLSVPAVYEAGFTELRAINEVKPLMVAETGCSTNGGDKAQWLTDCLAAMASDYRFVDAFCYFNFNKLAEGSSNFLIDSSPDVQAAYAAGMVQGYFVDNRFGQESQSPIPLAPAYFRPPTFQLPHDETGTDRLWSRVFYPRGRTVLNPEPTTGMPTEYPGRQEVEADLVVQVEAGGGRAYVGGGIYNVAGGEEDVLAVAGYGAHISGVGP